MSPMKLHSLKPHWLVLAFACMASASTLAIAETPKSVRVPAGDLADALESLATQCGVDVIYPSGLLKGRETQGVSGTFESRDAFRKLLEGTPLVLREEGGALLITQAASAPPLEVSFDPPAVTSAQSATGPIEEVQIEGRREKSSVMRAELERLEAQFYAEYNKLNTESQYDIFCETQNRTGTHFPVRICEPAFLTRAKKEAASATLGGFPAFPIVMQRARDYQKKMIATVAKHPELLELARRYNALARRYDDALKQEIKRKAVVRN